MMVKSCSSPICSWFPPCQPCVLPRGQDFFCYLCQGVLHLPILTRCSLDGAGSGLFWRAIQFPPAICLNKCAPRFTFVLQSLLLGHGKTAVWTIGRGCLMQLKRWQMFGNLRCSLQILAWDVCLFYVVFQHQHLLLIMLVS